MFAVHVSALNPLSISDIYRHRRIPAFGTLLSGYDILALYLNIPRRRTASNPLDCRSFPRLGLRTSDSLLPDSSLTTSTTTATHNYALCRSRLFAGLMGVAAGRRALILRTCFSVTRIGVVPVAAGRLIARSGVGLPQDPHIFVLLF
jgi:hypothetical protein